MRRESSERPEKLKISRLTGSIFGAGRLLLLGFVSALFQSSNAQVVGVDTCACSPSKYEFTMDFSLTCPPVNITRGDAVAATTCLVSPFGDPEVTDLVPVTVQSIDILELNQNLQIMVQENIAGNFVDGDTFHYTSISALPSDITDPFDVPRAIQLNIIGVNKFDEPTINVYLLTFTNDCAAFPVLLEGQSAGWTVFSDLEPPRQELCPEGSEIGAPSLFPSLAPSEESRNPTVPPSQSPAPSLAPSEGSRAPTESPIHSPGKSDAPSLSPSDGIPSPTDPPSQFPAISAAPSLPPSEGSPSPTDYPSPFPTISIKSKGAKGYKKNKTKKQKGTGAKGSNKVRYF